MACHKIICNYANVHSKIHTQKTLQCNLIKSSNNEVGRDKDP